MPCSWLFALELWLLPCTFTSVPVVRPQVLKQKRLYENQREQLYNQQFNMEQTSFALESIKDTAQTVQAMKAAGTELKSAFKKQDLNIDSIEKLQDEMADLMVISRPLQRGPSTCHISPWAFKQCMGPLGRPSSVPVLAVWQHEDVSEAAVHALSGARVSQVLDTCKNESLCYRLCMPCSSSTVH